MKNTLIIGSGSYIPEMEVENATFKENPFSFDDGRKIQARRYPRKEQSCSEIACISAKKAIENARIDP